MVLWSVRRPVAENGCFWSLPLLFWTNSIVMHYDHNTRQLLSPELANVAYEVREINCVRRGRIMPFTLSHSTRWKWAVNFTTRPPYPRNKHRYQLNRKLGGPLNRPVGVGEEKIMLVLPGFEPWNIQPQAPSLYRLRYPSSSLTSKLYKSDVFCQSIEIHFQVVGVSTTSHSSCLTDYTGNLIINFRKPVKTRMEYRSDGDRALCSSKTQKQNADVTGAKVCAVRTGGEKKKKKTEPKNNGIRTSI